MIIFPHRGGIINPSIKATVKIRTDKADFEIVGRRTFGFTRIPAYSPLGTSPASQFADRLTMSTVAEVA